MERKRIGGARLGVGKEATRLVSHGGLVVIVSDYGKLRRNLTEVSLIYFTTLLDGAVGEKRSLVQSLVESTAHTDRYV